MVQAANALSLGAPSYRQSSSVRWWGGGFVLLLHLVVLIALLMLTHDRPTETIRPAMLLTRLSPTRPAPPPTVPLFDARLKPTLPSPPLITPSFALRAGPGAITVPAAESPAAPKFLDFSIKHDDKKTMEDLFPSKEARLKQFFIDQAKRDAIDNENTNSNEVGDCSVSSSSAQNLSAPAGNGISSQDVIPAVNCSKKKSYRALQERNDLYSPK